jgi:NTP pyrophosphatase (non-canonical NTP hydrolase)
MITIRQFQDANARRAVRWHGTIDAWSGLEWAGAMCGEAGEAANVAKKLRRLEQELSGNQFSEHVIADQSELVVKLGMECADTFAYLVLLCARYGIDLETYASEKFNKISEQMGFPERI